MVHPTKKFYSHLKQDDAPNAALEKLLPQSQDGQDDDFQFVDIVYKRPYHRFLPPVANGLFLCLSILFFVYSANKTPTDTQCGKQLSTSCEWPIIGPVIPCHHSPDKLPQPLLSKLLSTKT